MTPTPPSTTSSSAGGQSPDAQYRVVRKRNRVPLSCAPCRHRKLKCNRAIPCDNCIKRGDGPSCQYAAPGNRKRNQSSGGASTSSDEMQNRIDRLEGLVLSLMTNGSSSVGPAAAAAAIQSSRRAESMDATSPYADDEMNQDDRGDDENEVDKVSHQIGVMKVTNDRQFFASEAHWWAILSDIAEVKSYFNEHKKQYEEQMRKVKATKLGESTIGSAFLFKGTKKADKSEILAHFPSRANADRLIARFMNSRDPSIYILHAPTFQKQYEKHWQDPGETSVVWIGMCFAMMSLALQSYHRACDEPPECRGRSWQDSLMYSEWTAQCIVHGDFTQPVNFMIETLCFYLQAEYARSRDAETGVWILSGIITRLALRMGFHRDSKPYASLSPFQGEMRRRIWTTVRFADILFSFQVGLPSAIRSNETDTTIPSNIFDEDFDEDSEVLPASRPASEPTPASYMIAKASLAYCFGRIGEQTQALNPLSYEVIMKLDADLRDTRENLAPHLCIRPLSDAILDPASLIMQRFNLDLLYQKAQCVLHRKFLRPARLNPRYAYSRRTCIDACLQMLAHQATLQSECQSHGRLRSVSWSITSLTTHDFLLAAMIICLDLYHTAEAEASGLTSGDMYAWAQERRDDMFAAIEQAVSIWESLRDQSMEAYKASVILSVMIDKLRNHANLRQQLSNNFSFTNVANGVAADGRVAPEHSAAMTLGMMSAGGMTPDAMGMYDKNYLGAMGRTGLTPQTYRPDMLAADQQPGGQGAYMEGMTPFSTLFGPNIGAFQGMDLLGNNIDWDTFDTYIQGANLDTGTPGMFFDPSLTDASPLSSTQDNPNSISAQLQPVAEGQGPLGSMSSSPNA